MKVSTILQSVKNTRTIKANLEHLGLKFTSDTVLKNFVKQWCKVENEGLYYQNTKIW